MQAVSKTLALGALVAIGAVVFLGLLVVLFPLQVHATNGYFTHGCGTEAKGMAGAGSALPLGPLSAAKNPAALVQVGTRYDAGVALFHPNREFSVRGNPSGLPQTFGLETGRVKSDSPYFPLPSAGASWSLDRSSALGFAIFGNGGMNTDYDSSVFGAGPTGIDMAQIFASPTYSRRFADRHAFGISAIVAVQYFEARGLGSFGQFSGDANNLSDRGRDHAYGFGARIGYLGEWLPNLWLGGSFQTRLAMTEFDRYAGLFAEQGDFDIPKNWTVATAFRPHEQWTIAFDFERFHYSDVSSVGNAFLPNLMNEPLGESGAAGFGWEDMNVYKLGFQWDASDAWALRAGTSYGEQPIPSSEVLFNIVAPGVIEHHVSAGFTRDFGGTALHGAVTHALSQKVMGTNPLEAPERQTIELEMNQWDFELGFSFVP